MAAAKKTKKLENYRTIYLVKTNSPIW